MGRRTDPDPDGRYIQAERNEVSYLLRAYACGLAAGCDRFFYFYLQEFLEYGIYLWGILRNDLSPKPAYMALANLVRQVGAAHTIGHLCRGEAYCVVLEREPGDFVAIAWSLDGSTLELPIRGRGAVVDPMGTTVRDLAAGVVSLSTSDQPVFVHGIDPTAMALTPLPPAPHHTPHATSVPEEMYVWLQAVTRPDQPWPGFHDLGKNKLALETAPGQVEELALRVHNYGQRDASVRLAVDLPQGWKVAGPAEYDLKVAAGTSAETHVKMTVGVLDDDNVGVSARLWLDGHPRDIVRVCYCPRRGD